MMQVAVEAEVDEFLGRVRYERRDDDDRPLMAVTSPGRLRIGNL